MYSRYEINMETLRHLCNKDRDTAKTRYALDELRLYDIRELASTT